MEEQPPELKKYEVNLRLKLYIKEKKYKRDRKLISWMNYYELVIRYSSYHMVSVI